MKIAIIGTGAMGSIYAARFSKAGHEVIAIDIWKDHVDYINKNGLMIEGPDETIITKNIQASTKILDLKECDFCVIATKALNLEESIKYFNLEGIGKSPSKLDMSRILSMNEHYIKTIDEDNLYNQLVEYCKIYKEKINSDKEEKIKSSLSFLKNKAKTLEDIYNNAKYIIIDEVKFKNDDLKLIDEKAKKIIAEFKNKLSSMDSLNKEKLILSTAFIKIEDLNKPLESL